MRSTGLVLAGLWPSKTWRQLREAGWRRMLQRPLPAGGMVLAVLAALALAAA